VVPIRSGNLAAVYDLWLDVNDDDRIDMKDLGMVAKAFGAKGLPGENLTKGTIAYDSDWIDITDKRGQDIFIAHDLNSMDLIVDIQGKVTPDSGPHQRNYGLPSYTQGWSKIYGGTDIERGYALVQTDDDGYAMTGPTYSFGEGDCDFWLVKTDGLGTMEWNNTYGGPDEDYAYALVQTSDGGYAIAGDTRSYDVGNGDFWLVKTDANGIMQWNHTYGGPGEDVATDLMQTSDGGYVMAGYYCYSGAVNGDAWLVKTDANGIMQWNQTYGGPRGESAHVLIKTNDGGYALAGWTEAGAGEGDCYLVKTDANGIMQWNHTYGGPRQELAYDIVQDQKGGFVLAGFTHSFGVGTPNYWLIKTDSVGNMEWNKTYGGANTDYAKSVIQTDDGGYVVAGHTDSFSRFGDHDIWLIKTDGTGNEQWNKTYGCTGNEYLYMDSMIKTRDGGYAIAGTWDYNGICDFWLIKTDSTGNIGGAESGLAWVDSSPNTITLYRGATDPHWNYVRVRLWKPKTP
jgi:hypothetical protein